MEETCIGSYRDNQNIDQEKGQVAPYRGKQNETNPGQAGSYDKKESGPEPVYQISDEGPLRSPFKPGSAKKKGDGGSAHSHLGRRDLFRQAFSQSSLVHAGAG